MPGFIIYQGPSLIDGKPIVVIYLTGSKNVKTGNMAQTYVLRSDIDPITASRIGEDYSICGDCPHRGTPNPNKTKGWADNRACYVNLIHGPNQVYKAFKAGKYKPAGYPTLGHGWMPLQDLGEGQNIRIGSYGDPLAVPSAIWTNLTRRAQGWTGYTHQATNNPHHGSIVLCMMSADTPAQAQDMHNQGKRTFRIIPITDWQAQGKAALLQSEILCPASTEAGKVTTCYNCNLCQGQTLKAKSIAIVAHGKGRKHIT